MKNDNEYIHPPNTCYDILSHPSGRNEAIEVAVVQEHRWVFYYWFKWGKKREGKKPSSKSIGTPSLLTFDWHSDLFPPREGLCEELQKINLDSYRKVALSCWETLHPHNDGHILSAAYLNLIGNIYVVCKQKVKSPDSFKDLKGNFHNIYCFNSVSELMAKLECSKCSNIYLDIDLDYFTESEDICGGGESVKLVEEKEIFKILEPSSNLMRWIFERLSGFTIATEPEFCGGLSNSNKIFSIIDAILFKPQLLSPYHRSCKWKHLSASSNGV